MGERMPAERTTMRQVREVLRLRTAGVGRNEIARRVGVAPSTVRLTLKRLASAGLTWPLPAEMTDSALETALFAAAGTKQGHRRHGEPDWAEIHRCGARNSGKGDWPIACKAVEKISNLPKGVLKPCCSYLRYRVSRGTRTLLRGALRSIVGVRRL